MGSFVDHQENSYCGYGGLLYAKAVVFFFPEKQIIFWPFSEKEVGRSGFFFPA